MAPIDGAIAEQQGDKLATSCDHEHRGSHNNSQSHRKDACILQRGSAEPSASCAHRGSSAELSSLLSPRQASNVLSVDGRTGTMIECAALVTRSRTLLNCGAPGEVTHGCTSSPGCSSITLTSNILASKPRASQPGALCGTAHSAGMLQLERHLTELGSADEDMHGAWRLSAATLDGHGGATCASGSYEAPDPEYRSSESGSLKRCALLPAPGSANRAARPCIQDCSPSVLQLLDGAVSSTPGQHDSSPQNNRTSVEDALPDVLYLMQHLAARSDDGSVESMGLARCDKIPSLPGSQPQEPKHADCVQSEVASEHVPDESKLMREGELKAAARALPRWEDCDPAPRMLSRTPPLQTYKLPRPPRSRGGRSVRFSEECLQDCERNNIARLAREEAALEALFAE